MQRLSLTLAAFLVGISHAQAQPAQYGGMAQEPPFIDYPKMLAVDEFVPGASRARPALNEAATAIPKIAFVSATSFTAPPRGPKGVR